jgi:phosphoglycerate dehydrogenase-like enzyme
LELGTFSWFFGTHFIGVILSKPNAALTMARAVDQFITPEQMARLKSLVNLTIPEKIDRSEEAYSALLQELGAEIVVTGWGSPLLTEGVFAANPQLKYMAHLTGTVREMVEKGCIEQGLLVTNWGNLIGKTVAEGALMAILSCLRRTTYVTFLMHQEKGWQARDEEPLFKKTIGLHGFGNIAQHLIPLLAPFDCDIETYSPYTDDSILEEYGVRRQTDLKALYTNNHIVSIHAARTPETFHIVDAKMHDGAVLVNSSRGALVDTEALIAELKTGRIYASLDVYEKEPLPATSELRGLLNCQLACHSAGPTPDSMVDFGEAAIDNIERYVKAEDVERIVDAELY